MKCEPLHNSMIICFPRFWRRNIRGLHGYSHEEPNKLSAEQNADIFNHTYQLLTDFVGEPPKGIVTPMCQISEASAQLLVDKGMEYDHSAMHRDCVPYYLRVGDQWVALPRPQLRTMANPGGQVGEGWPKQAGFVLDEAPCPWQSYWSNRGSHELVPRR